MKKKLIMLSGLVISVVVVLFIFVSCQGATAAEASSTTAAEASSTTVAEASVDSSAVAGDNSTCADCHNNTTLIVSKEVQYSNSVHGTGLNFERNTAACAVCHTSEGFTERIAAGTGKLEVAEDAPAIQNASPVNCRTCHNIHDTYTKADWALKTTSAVTIQLTGDVYDKGGSNLCVNCHQPRLDYTIPVAAGGDVEIKSVRFGPHYGVQSTMLLGVGGYGEYKGSNVHYDAVDEGCISCHMTDSAFGKQAGGHTLKMSYTYREAKTEFLAGCLKCHEDIESFDRNGVQTETAKLVEELHSLLVKQGLLDAETGSGIVGTFSSEQLGALWNYKTVEGDKSGGVHNPGYAKFLLQTGIDALKGK